MRVYITNSESKANYKVFIVASDSRQKNYQLIKDGRLVTSESQADVKIFLVNSESKANILITAKNMPK